MNDEPDEIDGLCGSVRVCVTCGESKRISGPECDDCLKENEDAPRLVASPHLSPEQVKALEGAPVLDGEGYDACIIIDVQDGRAVYDADALEALDREWFWHNIEGSVESMGPRAPILKWAEEQEE